MAKTIQLTKGYVAIVDAADYLRLSAYKWHAAEVTGGLVYAARRAKVDGKWRLVYMHREILGLECGDKRKGDHESGDTLDNRRSNIRIATHAQNIANQKRRSDNRSGYRGVHWAGDRKRWRAQIKVLGRVYHLGEYVSPIDAAKAYDRAAREHFGEFARLNLAGPATERVAA
jgi:AP2 domain.